MAHCLSLDPETWSEQLPGRVAGLFEEARDAERNRRTHVARGGEVSRRHAKLPKDLHGSPVGVEEAEDQRTKGPEDQGTRGPRDQRTKGPEDKGTRGPRDEGTIRPGPKE